MVVSLKIQIHTASWLVFSSKVAFFPPPSQDPELHFFGILVSWQFLQLSRQHTLKTHKQATNNAVRIHLIMILRDVGNVNWNGKNYRKCFNVYIDSHAPQNAYKRTLYSFSWTFENLNSLTASVIPEIPALVTAFVTTSDVSFWFVTDIWRVIFLRICNSRSRNKVCRSLLLTKLDVSHWRSDSGKSSCWSPKSISLTDSLTWAST